MGAALGGGVIAGLPFAAAAARNSAQPSDPGLLGRREDPVARIDVLSGRDEGQEFFLTKDKRFQIGTGRKSEIRLRDPGVGFKHAALFFREGCFWLSVERAGCETTARGEAVEPGIQRPLTSGDLLSFGSVQARYIRLDHKEQRPKEGQGAEGQGDAEPPSSGGAELS